MVDTTFTREELQGRVDGLREALIRMELDGALIFQRADLIYYTGAAYQGALAVPASGDAQLYVWRGAGLIGRECPAEVIPVRGFGRLHESLEDMGVREWKRIGFEEDVLPVSMHKRMISKLWPSGESVDISGQIRSQRMVKSDAELARVTKASRTLSIGFQSLIEILHEGIFEYEAQALMDVVLRGAGDQAGGRVRGFNAEARGVVAAGSSAAVPNAFDGPIGQPGRYRLSPMGAGGAEVQRGEPIIVDHTCGVEGYMSDMTRTFAVGELDSRFTDAHDFCVDLHKRTLEKMVPGAVPGEIWNWALAEAEKAGYAENFMNRGDSKVRFMGHGIGIEMDEWPVIAKPFAEPLQANMTIAVEPKIIFDDGGVGVEDTVVVTEEGARPLTEMGYEIHQAKGEPLDEEE